MADDVDAAPTADSTPAASEAAPAPAPSPAPSPAPAETAAPSTGETPAKSTLLDAVLKVVPATNERDVLDDGKATPAPQGDQPEDPGQVDTEPETDADDDTLPEGVAGVVHKKFTKLLTQRKALRAEVESMRRPAEIGGELEKFAKANDLSGDDIGLTLKMAASLRIGDYKTFYEAVAPYVRTAQEYLGVVLPKDLQQRVRAGHMTEDAAKEFARQRFDSTRSQMQLESTSKAMSQQRVQAAQGDVHRAVTSFEARLSQSDPDYKVKAPFVKRAVQGKLLERGGNVANTAEALEIVKQSYAEANQLFSSLQPAPRATQPRPNGSTQTPSVRSAPKSLMEAALLGVENARRAGGQ